MEAPVNGLPRLTPGLRVCTCQHQFTALGGNLPARNYHDESVRREVREKPESRESGGPVAEPVEGCRASGGGDDQQRHAIESASENAQEPKRHRNHQDPNDGLGHGKWRTRSEESNMPHSLDCFPCQEPGDEEHGGPGKGGKPVSGDVVSHLLSHRLTAAAPFPPRARSKPPRGSITRRWWPSLAAAVPWAPQRHSSTSPGPATRM